MELDELLAAITPADQSALDGCRKNWDAIAKPLNGLGHLEEMLVRVAGATGKTDLSLGTKAVAVFCADNGVVAQGVTQTGQEVTLAVAKALGEGCSSVCHMARVAGAKVVPVDVGILAHAPVPGVRDLSVRPGTADMTKGPAMSREEAQTALMAGAQIAMELDDQDIALLAAGEMGIGNTTTTAAVTSVLLDLPPSVTAGRGAGLSDAGLVHKVTVIQRALVQNQPNRKDPLDVLSKVGGLDIAAMTGFYLGAAARNRPVLLDGAISCAAALLAVRLCPNARKAMLASHRPAEPCGQLLLQELGLEPVLDAGLHLGEGTGAVAAMPLLDMALSVYQNMSTFDHMGIEAYQPDGRAVSGPARAGVTP